MTFIPPREIRIVTIEFTNYCNLSCWMCPHNIMTRSTGFMSLDLVKRISPQLGKLNLEQLGLHGIGESLLHPQLREALEILREDNPNVHMGLATNGTFLTEKNYNKVDGLIDEVSVAIDGFTQETYEKHRTGGDFNKVLEHVHNIMEYRDKIGSTRPYIAVQMIDLGQGEEEKAQFEAFWKPKVLSHDKVRFITKANFGGQIPGIDFQIKKCAALYAQISILWDGRMTTCCWDSDGKNVMGNLNEEMMNEIFLSQKYDALREKHELGTLQKEKHLLCNTCLVPAC